MRRDWRSSLMNETRVKVESECAVLAARSAIQRASRMRSSLVRCGGAVPGLVLSLLSLVRKAVRVVVCENAGFGAVHGSRVKNGR